jgi:hypothetical protein
MVLARVANLFSTGDSTTNLVDDRQTNVPNTVEKLEQTMADTVGRAVEGEIDTEAARPPYLHVRMPNWDEMDVN